MLPPRRLLANQVFADRSGRIYLRRADRQSASSAPATRWNGERNVCSDALPRGAGFWQRQLRRLLQMQCNKTRRELPMNYNLAFRLISLLENAVLSSHRFPVLLLGTPNLGTGKNL